MSLPLTWSPLVIALLRGMPRSWVVEVVIVPKLATTQSSLHKCTLLLYICGCTPAPPLAEADSKFHHRPNYQSQFLFPPMTPSHPTRLSTLHFSTPSSLHSPMQEAVVVAGTEAVASCTPALVDASQILALAHSGSEENHHTTQQHTLTTS